MKSLKRNALIGLAAMLACAASAKVTPNSMIGDNMVLQQNSAVELWGKAAPNVAITIAPSWTSETVSVTTDADGNWKGTVNTPSASFEPQTITISDGESLTLGNILIGEVWLASGQSNMEMPLKGFGGCCLEGGYDEITNSRQYADKIRFFMVPLTQSYEPVEDVNSQWYVPSPDSAPNFSATAWFFAKRLAEVLDVPVGIVNCAYGGARVESWTPRDMLEQYPDVSLDPAEIEKMVHYVRPLLMYNAMFNPVKDYGYAGIIWYQGCSNVGAHEQYAERLAAMVNRWRKEIGQGDIPFYAVEIAPYDYDGTQDEMSPYLREAQWDAVELMNNADMICINDLVKPYERYNIHPADKKGVGSRLGDLALNRTYDKKQYVAGSLEYAGSKFENGEAWVKINHKGNGIARNYDIQGFEVAGADKVFYPADAARLNWQTDEVVVSSTQVPEPVAVRYCWGDFKLGTLYGANYLPLIPFRSDNW